MAVTRSRLDRRNLSGVYPLDVVRVGDPADLPLGTGDPDQGAIVKDEEKDHAVWEEYLKNVMKKRGADWRPLFSACSEYAG